MKFGKIRLLKGAGKIMKQKIAPICNTHTCRKEWRSTDFEYEENGISVRVPNVFAWVCPEDGEASFTPDTVDELIMTVRELLETAKRAKARKSISNEFIVTVS